MYKGSYELAVVVSTMTSLGGPYTPYLDPQFGLNPNKEGVGRPFPLIWIRAPEVHLTRRRVRSAAFFKTSLSNTLPMHVYRQN